MSLTAEELRSLWDYDPERGVFVRRHTHGRWKAGSDVTGTLSHGYLRAHVLDKPYAVHRLAFLWMTGQWPSNDVDHINGDRADNRWVNLRDVTRSVNLQNLRGAKSNNKGTGLLGAAPWGKRFRAAIRVNGVDHKIGVFDTPQEAHAAYIQAKRELHEGAVL
ncbi:MAG: hypothetical protein RL227_1363 [Pseudomonadota bacterium]|jgi:hypothetical protein